MINENIKIYLKKNKKLLSFLLHCYNLVLSSNFKVGKRNFSDIGSVFLKRSNLRVSGKNNKVIVKDFTRLVDCNIEITGDNNVMSIGKKANLNKTNIFISGNNNKFSIGNYTTTNSSVEFNVIDGTKLIIGEDCMFSRNINLWTGDYHSVINSNGERINPSKNIIIGDHVWIGTESNILKGSQIHNNSIIGADSLVTRKFTKDNIIIAGDPAIIIKEGINWSRESI